MYNWIAQDILIPILAAMCIIKKPSISNAIYLSVVQQNKE